MGSRSGHLGYVADFEANTREDNCRVWAWAIVPIGSHEVVYGTDIQSFMSYVKKLSGKIYFHNLAYDSAFILDYELKQGRVWSENQFPKYGEFTGIIDKSGKFYQISMKNNGKYQHFVDSYKLLPFSVAAIAKAFDLDMEKGDLDYETERPIGHELTEDEKFYIKRDVCIVADALYETLTRGKKRLTVGSEALADFKDIMSRKVFETTFPVLPKSMDDDIRHAYRGGFTYVDENWKQKFVGNINVYDVNSLYPYVMESKALPYGEPIFVEGDADATDTHPLWIKAVMCTFKLKECSIPTIQIKGSRFFNGVQYQTEVKEPAVLYLTNVDFELMQEQYDVDVLAVLGTYLFRARSDFFIDYVDKWRTIKETSTGAQRTLAKLHLNSLYGKFASSTDATGKFPYLDGDVVKLALGPECEKKPVYTPMGVFITAYARAHTIRAAQEHYGQFCYADTDSLHMIGEAHGLEIHPTKFGAWKHEGRFERAIYLRPKQYMEQKPGGEYDVHIAGLPRNIANSLTFSDIYHQHKIPGKLVPKRVSGGIILVQTDFTIDLS